tara:strand:+ start:7888 stop:11622 length:3735 start_codon:yes stop_codon:yes gene_type:complete
MLSKKIILLLTLGILGCSTSETYINRDYKVWQNEESPSENDLVYKVFLIGDAGAPSLDVQEPTLKLFQKFVEEASDKSAAVFLGDNIYLNGLPDSAASDREFAESRIIEQMKTLDNFKGKVFFIPGNHDWDDGGKNGLEAVRRQEKFVENYLDRGNTFYPDDGFPGPVDIKLIDEDEDSRLRDDIRLIVLDTQWWLHENEKAYGDTGEYELFDGGDFLNEFEDILKDRQNDFLIVAGHHPLISQDRHGGYQPLSTHLKPPVFGSLYAFYRRAFGFEQDLTHHKYRDMANTFKSMFAENDHLIYASGHAHSLQYYREKGKRETQHYVVSGGGSKSSFVAEGRKSEFSHQGKGFITIQYYGDGSVWMEAWTPIGDGSSGELLYKTQLKGPYKDPLLTENIEELPDINYTDSTITIAPNATYDDKGKLFEIIAGKHNRRYWSIENEVPYFDVTEIKGGLIPVRMGGKGQSNTLHLEDKSGNEFVLRSVDKQAGKIWDEGLKKSIALDLAQDQFSILNPYAALIIPVLADAVDVYHTNPKIYYVPHDPQLGRYAEEIGGQLALFEEKPDNDMSSVKSVGYSEEVIATRDFIREIDGDIDHRVDQGSFARARLLDLFVGDWDRHTDQWRWASFEPEDEQGKIYKPIPRDRDVAMMKMTGIAPELAKFGPFFQYQSFGEDYGNLIGLSYNSLGLTRRLTSELTKEDWLEIAQTMVSQLSDEVIIEAVKKYPPAVYAEFGEETIQSFKARRDELVNISMKYYSMLSGVVSVSASNKRERFIVEVPNNDEVIVRVHKLSGKGKLRESYYERTFSKEETSELRLFGMGGDDEFVFIGERSPSIKILVSGGPGDDVYTDDSEGKVTAKKVEFFETEKGNEYEVSKKAHQHLTSDPIENRYKFEKDFSWNRSFPGYYFAYNDDDGLFLGGGPRIVRYGFKKNPAVTHNLRLNYAPKTGAANLVYNGKWFSRISDWDLGLDASFLFPKSYKNFYGLGNETTKEERNAKYYKARLSQYSIQPRISKNIDNTFSIFLGSGLSITDVNRESDETNVLNELDLGISPDSFDQQWFNSVIVGFTVKDLDNAMNPQQGYKYSFSSDINVGVVNTAKTFSRLTSSLQMFYPVSFAPQVTFAQRIGSAHNIGSFPFYEANTVGGTTNLRGFYGNRFSGRTTFYSNTEVRLELLNFYRYLLGGRLGLTGFFDTGRVWTDGEASDFWHKGYGGGVWFNAFESVLINSTVGVSKEGALFELKAGFFF